MSMKNNQFSTNYLVSASIGAIVALGAMASGRQGGPGAGRFREIEIVDSSGRPRIRLALSKNDETASIYMLDTEGRTRWVCGVEAERTYQKLYGNSDSDYINLGVIRAEGATGSAISLHAMSAQVDLAATDTLANTRDGAEASSAAVRTQVGHHKAEMASRKDYVGFQAMDDVPRQSGVVLQLDTEKRPRGRLQCIIDGVEHKSLLE
jgi:hypothetical protein